MEQKTIPAQKAIAKSVQTTLKNIAESIGDWPAKLWQESQSHGLRMAGAPVYIYRGCDESPETEFTLQMCFPVESFDEYTGSFEKIELRPYDCYEALYVGSMPEMSEKGWAPFMKQVQEKNITWGQESREVYIRWLGFDSPENQVLLQVERVD